MLYLCDNQALLKAVKRWVGESSKTTLVGAPGAEAFDWKQSKSFEKEQQEEQRRFWSRQKHIEENWQ